MPQFRAYDKDRKIMADVFGMDIPNGILVVFTKEKGREYWIRDKVILIRWTGLVDSGSELIFQGDVIKQNFQNEFGSFTPGIGVVIWNNPDAAFYVRFKGEFYGIGKSCKRLGSDFTNPEIMNEAVKRKEA